MPSEAPHMGHVRALIMLATLSIVERWGWDTQTAIDWLPQCGAGYFLPNCWPGPVGTVGRLDPTLAAPLRVGFDHRIFRRLSEFCESRPSHPTIPPPGRSSERHRAMSALARFFLSVPASPPRPPQCRHRARLDAEKQDEARSLGIE